jgi:flavin-dependent dehydrogenase
LDIGLPDEQGVLVKAGSQLIHANILVVACELPRELRRPLGIADAWDRNLMQRYSFITLQPDSADRVSRPLMPMSLDLKGTSAWAWMLPGREQMQLAVQQPLLGADQVKPCELLRHWAMVLGRHGLLQQSQNLSFEKIQSIDFPAAAALEVDGVANRTLLIGPAGGFYSAGGEDIYPNCWSAIHAADVIRKALKQPHLQDALQPYRTRWRTTLGEYLRGPQQNLRFLLPLAYRNPKMSSRLAESILQGKSLVR